MNTSTPKPLGRRHKRATNNPDHARRTHVATPDDHDIEQRLTDLVNRAHVRDRIIKLGIYRSNRSSQPVRLIEVYVAGAWRQYVTNVLDPRQLNIVEVVELYEYRWRIKTAFLLVKRLLDLAYLWVGRQNGSSCRSGRPGCTTPC